MATGDRDEQKLSVVAASSLQVAEQVKIIRFRGRPLVLTLTGGFEHYVPLRKENFDRIAYQVLGGVSRSRVSDVFAYVSNMAEDMTENEHLVLFGTTELDEFGAAKGVPLVWDMEGLTWSQMPPMATVWRSPYAPVLPKIGADGKRRKLEFVMDLAGGDEGLYDDMMQSMAPIIMSKKPDGVIWWVGDGANGKSTLMDALYRIFPGQFSSITVKRLVDGRDTPSLNGTLANVVKESSEGRVEDTEIYKALGTHENFRVHKFHSQDDIEINANLHHIFSANHVPTFNDKGWSARRRTFIIPFTQRFASDPTFEERTFTDEMFGRLIVELTYYAARIREQGYKYKWSAATLAAKANYDEEANNAEVFVRELLDQGMVAFNSFRLLYQEYTNWCLDNGYVALGIGNLRKATGSFGFDRTTSRMSNGANQNVYRIPTAVGVDLLPLSLGKPGLYTAQGFAVQPTSDVEAIPEIPDQLLETEDGEPAAVPRQEPPTRKSILKGAW